MTPYFPPFRYNVGNASHLLRCVILSYYLCKLFLFYSLSTAVSLFHSYSLSLLFLSLYPFIYSSLGLFNILFLSLLTSFPYLILFTHITLMFPDFIRPIRSAKHRNEPCRRSRSNYSSIVSAKKREGRLRIEDKMRQGRLDKKENICRRVMLEKHVHEREQQEKPKAKGRYFLTRKFINNSV